MPKWFIFNSKYLICFRRDSSFWSWLVEIIFFLELTCLTVLTCVTSLDNFRVHRNSFFAFIAFSTLHMVVRVHQSRRLLKRNYMTLTLVKRKLMITVLYFVSVILAALMYIMHNTLCIAGFYTLFALCEYIVVIINLTFHNLVASNFSDHLLFIKPGELFAISA